MKSLGRSIQRIFSLSESFTLGNWWRVVHFVAFWGGMAFVVANPCPAQLVWTEHVVAETFEDAFSVDAADLDGDGDMDVVCGSYIIENTLAWFENISIDQFIQHTLSDSDSIVSSVLVIDLDSDGDLEILSTASRDGRVILWRNHGNGVFIREDIGILPGATSLRAADLDNDGDFDIIACGSYTDRIDWWENIDGIEFDYHLLVEGIQSPIRVNIGDIDEDGDFDLSASTFETGEFFWIENQGEGVFESHFLGSGYQRARAVEIADMNGDGAMDIVCSYVGNGSNGRVLIWSNDGSRHFAPLTINFNAFFPQDIAVVDFDLDGDSDVFVSMEIAGLALCENRGNFEFNILAFDDVICLTGLLDLADMDADGDIDLIFTSRVLEAIRWLENDTITDISPPQVLPSKFLSLKSYPNPFNKQLSIELSSLATSDFQVAVFDALGRLVDSVHDGMLPPGHSRFYWNANGRASGTYYITVSSDKIVETNVVQFIK